MKVMIAYGGLKLVGLGDMIIFGYQTDQLLLKLIRLQNCNLWNKIRQAMIKFYQSTKWIFNLMKSPQLYEKLTIKSGFQFQGVHEVSIVHWIFYQLMMIGRKGQILPLQLHNTYILFNLFLYITYGFFRVPILVSLQFKNHS